MNEKWKMLKPNTSPAKILPYFDKVNDQSLVAGNEGEKYERILVSKGNDYLFAYTFT